MNDSIWPCTVNERRRDQRQRVADESIPSSMPRAWQILLAVSNVRRGRAAHALLLAERNAQCARTRKEEAEAEAERLRAQISAVDRQWHRAQQHREMRGLDIHRARSAQAQREALIEKQADRVRARAQDCTQARQSAEQARRQHGRLARKAETLRAFTQRLDAGNVQ